MSVLVAHVSTEIVKMGSTATPAHVAPAGLARTVTKVRSYCTHLYPCNEEM